MFSWKLIRRHPLPKRKTRSPARRNLSIESYPMPPTTAWRGAEIVMGGEPNDGCGLTLGSFDRDRSRVLGRGLLEFGNDIVDRAEAVTVLPPASLIEPG